LAAKARRKEANKLKKQEEKREREARELTIAAHDGSTDGLG